MLYDISGKQIIFGWLFNIHFLVEGCLHLFSYTCTIFTFQKGYQLGFVRIRTNADYDNSA